MSTPTLADLADRAPLGPVPLADPDFMMAQTGPPPLPADVILRIRQPCPMGPLGKILCLADSIAALEGRKAFVRPCANYIEIFTQAKP